MGEKLQFSFVSLALNSKTQALLALRFTFVALVAMSVLSCASMGDFHSHVYVAYDKTDSQFYCV